MSLYNDDRHSTYKFFLYGKPFHSCNPILSCSEVSLILSSLKKTYLNLYPLENAVKILMCNRNPIEAVFVTSYCP